MSARPTLAGTGSSARRRAPGGGPLLPSRAHLAAAIAFPAAAALAFSGGALAALPLLAFVAACLAAPFFPSWKFFLPAVRRGPGDAPEVALTFDDGPDPRTIGPLLRLLEARGARATFFVVGERAAAHPEAIDAIRAAGHELGNHSLRHDEFLMLRSLPRLEADVVGCQEVLRRRGARTTLFRPPVGITNPRLGPVLERHGLTLVQFSVRPHDFANRRLRDLAGRVLRRVGAGDIVVLHDRLPADAGPGPWLDELERLFDGLEARGLRSVTVSELIAPRPQPVLAPLLGEETA